MRSIAIGLAAALFAAALSPAAALAKKADAPKAIGVPDEKSTAQGMLEAPPLVTQLALNCSPSNANYIGVAKQKNAEGKEVNQKIYEVVCQEGLGFMILATEGGAPTGFDCLALSDRKPKAGEKDNGGLFCRLPANDNPVMALQAVAARAGVTCTPTDGRWMGVDTAGTFNQYEVACADGAVYVLQVPNKNSQKPLAAVDCMRVEAGACKLFTEEKRMARIAALAAPANRAACQISNTRYMGTTSSNKNSFYEIACADGKSGYVLQVDATEKYVASMECVRASSIGGGCTLSAAGAQTDDLATYQRLIQQIAYPCKVSSYRSLGPDSATGREVVEVACSDHPDGAFAFLPVDRGQKGEVLNCVRAEARGLKCSLSPVDATYAKMSSQISATGKSCKVSKHRSVGVSATGEEYIEVACTGEPGLMLEFAPGSENLKSSMACLSARGIGGGCKLQ